MSTPEMKLAEMAKQIEALQAENARLNKQASSKVAVKYNEETGTLSVYGLQRFPVTLRPTQWKKLFSVQETIEHECTPERIAREDKDREALKVKKAAEKSGAQG